MSSLNCAKLWHWDLSKVVQVLLHSLMSAIDHPVPVFWLPPTDSARKTEHQGPFSRTRHLSTVLLHPDSRHKSRGSVWGVHPTLRAASPISACHALLKGSSLQRPLGTGMDPLLRLLCCGPGPKLISGRKGTF